jgi:hypothetical protein
MPETIHVPILGNMNKGMALAGGLAAVGVSGYLIYRHVAKSKVAASSSSATSTPGSYGYGSGANPYGYGSYGYGSNTGYYGYGFGPYGYGGFGESPFGPFGYGFPGSGTGTPLPTTPTTNAEWSNEVVAQLTQNGASAQTVLAALGQYLLGHSLTTDQQQIVSEAEAIAGPPPVAGPDGFPPQMRTGSGGGGTGQPGDNKIEVPNVVGLQQDNAFQVIQSVGLKPSGSRVIKGKILYVKTQIPKAGAKVANGSTVKLSSSVIRPKG